jgi:hypothetical protein
MSSKSHEESNCNIRRLLIDRRIFAGVRWESWDSMISTFQPFMYENLHVIYSHIVPIQLSVTLSIQYKYTPECISARAIACSVSFEIRPDNG